MANPHFGKWHRDGEDPADRASGPTSISVGDWPVRNKSADPERVARRAAVVAAMVAAIVNLLRASEQAYCVACGQRYGRRESEDAVAFGHRRKCDVCQATRYAPSHRHCRYCGQRRVGVERAWAACPKCRAIEHRRIAKLERQARQAGAARVEWIFLHCADQRERLRLARATTLADVGIK